MEQDSWYRKSPHGRTPYGRGLYRTFGDRVMCILKRISREKYIRPDDVKNIAYKICCKISNSPAAVISRMDHKEIFYVGMIHGEPLLRRDDPGYFDLMVFLRTITNLTDKTVEAELKILKMFIGINDRRSFIKRREDKLKRMGLY